MTEIHSDKTLDPYTKEFKTTLLQENINETETKLHCLDGNFIESKVERVLERPTSKEAYEVLYEID